MDDNRTVQLHVEDWMRCKIVLNQHGSDTPAIDELIRGEVERPELTRPWEWWCRLTNTLAKSEPKLANRITTQAVVCREVKKPPKPERHEVEYAKKYLDKDDDRELPEMEG